jgi:hydrophobe/amphiphile efflux-1 (HAE1) family protein
VSWPRLALRYRHSVFALLIALVVLGVAARFELPVELFPDSDPPVVTVITAYPGVAPADVANDLSKPIEEEIGGVDGLVRVTSTSQTGLSVVKAEFTYGRPVEIAAMDVQNAISRIRSKLPATIGEPQVLQFSSSDKPILTAALHSPVLPLTEVRDLADNEFRDRLQVLPGVAAVDVFGGHVLQLEIAVDRDRLRTHGLGLDAVRAALAGWNLSDSGGRVARGAQETVVRFDMPIRDAQEAEALVLAARGDRRVRLGDVADVRLAAREDRAAYRYNGEPAIAVQVLKRDEANTVEVAARVRAELERLGGAHPQLEVSIADDDSVFTELVISNMTATVATAIALTVAVIFLFLAHARQAAIISISIPVAFLITFALMYLAGVGLNMVTMSAIILSIGLLVDDGIVVLENVHRHMGELGKPPARAAIDGAEEIFLAKLGGTVTTLAVLLPLVFLGGFIGKLFGPLALTLIFALSASFVVAVTLIPLLTALWLRPEAAAPGRLARWVRPFNTLMDAVREGYLVLLGWALARPRTTLAITLVLLAVAMRLMTMIGSEMLPRFDSGNFQVAIDTVPGTPLEETLRAVAEVEALLLDEPHVVAVSTQVGYEPGGRFLGDRGAMDTSQAQITVNLTPRNRREDTLWAVMDRIRRGTAEIPGITLAVVKEKGATARSTTAAPIDVRLSGLEPAVLDELGDEVLARLQGLPGIADLYKNWALDTPELHVGLDRVRAAELGLTGKDVAQAVYEAVEGQAVTPLRRAGRRDLEVRVRYAEPDRRDITALEDIHLLGRNGIHAPLRELARLDERLGPRVVTREDYQNTLDVLGYNRGRPLSDLVADVQDALSGLALPPGYELAIAGEQSDFQEARSRMLRALALGALAVYLLLVVQFRSFKHPLTVMLAIPLQFVGVAVALLVAGKYVSMPALLGIILLLGIVVNNSIILLDFVLARRGKEVSLEESIMEAVAVRYRPIMMTALSSVAGMLPLALELAVGAERFSPIATVIIGGILASTVLTMIVIPVAFLLLDRREVVGATSSS